MEVSLLARIATLLLVFFAAFYSLLIAAFAVGFRIVTRRRYRRAQGNMPFVSVIVAARNEQEKIRGCIEAILENDYPEDLFDLTIVDDNSTDDTAAIVVALQERFNTDRKRLHLLQASENQGRDRAHKKYAVQKAVEQAAGEVILLTDADCSVPQGWISAMTSAFTPGTGLVSGPVLYRTDSSAFSRIQALEFLGLVAIGAGAIGLRHPNLCNGANVAYRRETFLQVGGYEGIDHVTSGDDEMLMQKIAAETNWKVRFCSLRAATVQTDPSPDLSSFAHQRRRWASKGTRYTSPWLVAMVIGIYTFFVLLLFSLPASIFINELWFGFGLALVLKVLSELSILIPAAVLFRRPALLVWFLPAQVLHIPYIVILPAAGLLKGYRWKDRELVK